MTETPSHGTPQPEVLPEVVVRPATRFRLIWVVPVVAVLIGIWLLAKSYIEAGPTITIIFKSAEGLQAGKTKIKYKDVEVGRVESIRLNSDLSDVIVTAKMVEEIKNHLSENTRFWTIRARVAAGEVSGIGTLLSGAYIGMDPGRPGKYADSFRGLESPPVVTLDMPGTYYNLRSDRLGSLDMGSPVYYHQIKVGQVVSYTMHPDGSALDIKVFIEAPHDQRVLENTRFWNASGLEMTLNSTGLRINTDSLVSLLLGGVAFATPPDEIPGPKAAEGRQFTLFPNRDKTLEPIYSQKMFIVARFDDAVRGLSKGADVEFQGIKVGEVVAITLQVNVAQGTSQVTVLMKIEPERFLFNDTANRVPKVMVLELIEKGLCAQLRTGILLTGQLYVNLVLADHPSDKPISFAGAYPVIPTIAGPSEDIISSVSSILNRLEALPIEQIGDDLQVSMHSIRQLVGSRDLKASLVELRQSLERINRFAGSLNTDTAPQLAAILEAANQALGQTRSVMQAAEHFLGADAPLTYELQEMVQELTKAGRAVGVLADYLERHPEALIFGKGASAP